MRKEKNALHGGAQCRRASVPPSVSVSLLWGALCVQMEKADLDKNGRIDFDEFMTVVGDAKRHLDDGKTVLLGFRVL